ncbi:hypothetical protein [Agarilytica rhodophyticola]|uniref:hypothetical protein n=1 Tax=Agarilytica rhodophyticola TaxID=1737490 RepID=UPI000B34681F|nr:hypothetical protein [Agarilytica rhodophyticola]
MSITLRTIGLFGILIFGILFSITFVSPGVIEDSMKGFVKYQIEKEVRQTYKSLVDSSVSVKARSIAKTLEVESDKIRENLDNNLPEKIASVIASMCGYDCERKNALAQSITSDYFKRLKKIKIAHGTLNDLIKGKYIEIIGNLKTDLRIFLGSNFSMFFILLVVSFAKSKAIVHLFLPGLLLTFATIIASSIYIYGQDWFYTILYNDYIGFSYLAYLSITFGFLIDIVLNKARITTETINGIASALGSSIWVIPC